MTLRAAILLLLISSIAPLPRAEALAQTPPTDSLTTPQIPDTTAVIQTPPADSLTTPQIPDTTAVAQTPPADSLTTPQIPDTTAVAQTPPADSLATPQIPDTTAVARRSARVWPPVGSFPSGQGVEVVGRPMVRTPYFHPHQSLHRYPGSFLYDTGLPGWPAGWSLYGLPPSVSGASLDGRRFDDLFTGASLEHLLPIELLEPLRVDRLGSDRGPVLAGHIRPLAGRPPITEIRYDQGSNKMQFVSVLHSQDRNRTLFGKPGRLNFLGRYGGRGSTSPYPSSNTRLRQIYLRLAYEQVRWLMELSYLRTHEERGAQAGVLPRAGRPFESVYEIFSPTVRLNGATRTVDRHDLALRARFRWAFRLEPLTAGLVLSPQANRFVLAKDTTRASALHWGLFVAQPLLRNRRQALALTAESYVNHVRARAAFLDTTGATYRTWRIALTDSASVFSGTFTARIGYQLGTNASGAQISGGYERSFGGIEVAVEAASTPVGPSHVDRFGFGSTLVGRPDLAAQGVRYGRWTVRGAWLGLSLEGGGSIASLLHGIDYVATSSLLVTGATLAQVVQPDDGQRWLGLDAGVGWRLQTRRGLFAQIRGRWNRRVEAPSSRPALDASLPEWTGESRLGLRAHLFKGDLKLTTYVQGSAWSTFRSRTLHPQTGLFVLPEADNIVLGPSGTLDLYAEGDVRTATLFFRLENILAGSVYPGTMVMPVFPLPRLALRFGVYWPLLN